MTNLAIHISNLSFNYPKRKVFEDFHLQITKGDVFGLLGPNGSGKTTLFHLLSTSVPCTEGQVKILGMDQHIDKFKIRNKIGVIFQNPSLDGKLTLYENLIHQGHLYGLQGDSLKNKIESLLKKLEIGDRKNDLIQTLSGGLRRRGEIAKGLLHDPELILMDEPSTGLDPAARKDLWNIIQELQKQQVTVVLTTHFMDEGDKCDKVAILDNGILQAIGTPDELKAKIGGDVLLIQSSDPESLVHKIKDQFKWSCDKFNGHVRLEQSDGHKIIPQLVEAFPGLIQSASVGKPTLEDVFFHKTGKAVHLS